MTGGPGIGFVVPQGEQATDNARDLGILSIMGGGIDLSYSRNDETAVSNESADTAVVGGLTVSGIDTY